MDALVKLRVLIWVLVISLWGVMVYQYLGDDEIPDAARMRAVAYHPAAPEPAAAPQPAAALPTPQDLAAIAASAGSSAAAPSGPDIAVMPRGEDSQVLSGLDADPARNVRPSPELAGPAPSDDRRPPEDDDTPVPEAPPSQAFRVARRAPARAPAPPASAPPQEQAAAPPEPATPPGFSKVATRHFNIYSEGAPASEALIELVENIHGNLMLDLAPFSPWADDHRVSIFLFRTQGAYRRMTGRPAWSGGASSVARRKVYLFDSEELPGILSHELTHIYFDGFFLGGTTDPLWLSEGMATLAQVERGLAAPSWLSENLATLESGGGIEFREFDSATTTSGWSDEKVRLWYAQAYSVVRYLIRAQQRSSFYRFAVYLRDGRPQAEALYRAYGAPYTRMHALELAWRRSITRRPAQPALPHLPPLKSGF